jgi:hypothetical protein
MVPGLWDGLGWLAARGLLWDGMGGCGSLSLERSRKVSSLVL